ncbi:GDSL-type esterase/lipase family protein [Pseudalkalibacillus sp. R45]|uniref:GDSL-type esterase/lipase family protein n=1 Tax=Pseudalkalibacillus sp. R45 TaxID=3457433 RepID=UPI003FCE8BB6
MKKQQLILFILIPLVIVFGVILFLNKDNPKTTPVLNPSIEEEFPREDEQVTEDPPSEDEDKKDEKPKDDQKETDEPVDETVIEDVHIVALGDSLTKGSGDKTKEGYIQPVARYIQENSDDLVSLKNFGIHGLPSDKLAAKMDEEEVQDHIREADHVFITIGGNDILNIVEYNFFSLNMDLFETGQQRYRKNLFVIVQTIRTLNPNANIYLVSMFNPFHNFFQDIKEVDGVINDWNSTAKTVAEINDNTLYVPIDDLFIEEGSEKLFANDKLHPNQEGYLKMADRIENYIQLEDEG